MEMELLSILSIHLQSSPFIVCICFPLPSPPHSAQRFFPEFYPSCYTEKRLNLKRLFAAVEKRSDLDDVDDVLLFDSSSGSGMTTGGGGAAAGSGAGEGWESALKRPAQQVLAKISTVANSLNVSSWWKSVKDDVAA